MQKDLFIVSTVNISDDLRFHLLFEKDMNLEELIECYLQIEIDLDRERKYKKTKYIRYIFKDKIISFDKFLIQSKQLISKTIETIDALNSGLNLVSEFYLETPGLDDTPVEIRRSLKRTLNSLDDFKLQPYVMPLYNVLAKFKGTDTLQQRKYQKMVETQQLIMQQSQKGVL